MNRKNNSSKHKSASTAPQNARHDSAAAGYAKNVGWLLVPVMAWNAAFFSQLPHGYSPEVFGLNIPPILSAIKNTLRIAVFALPFLAPFELIVKS